MKGTVRTLSSPDKSSKTVLRGSSANEEVEAEYKKVEKVWNSSKISQREI